MYNYFIVIFFCRSVIKINKIMGFNGLFMVDNLELGCLDSLDIFVNDFFDGVFVWLNKIKDLYNVIICVF